jgi:hypothetical protein
MNYGFNGPTIAAGKNQTKKMQKSNEQKTRISHDKYQCIKLSKH